LISRTGIGLLLLSAVATAAQAASVERGEYLTAAGGCITCHTNTAGKGEEFAGGRPIESPYGTFFSPNITPDMETGIGGWDGDSFETAMREGISPDGEHYYPAFPYTSYTGISRTDMDDILAYLQSLTPVRQEKREHELVWYARYRFGIGLWKLVFFDEQTGTETDPEQSDEWNRGAYLVRHLGHCGECHTTRGWAGNTQHDLELAGTISGVEGSEKVKGIPNITPERESGIGTWNTDDIEFFLEMGMTPDGDFIGDAMASVVDDNTALLTPADRRAMAVYLQSLAPLPRAGVTKERKATP
jgi:mono/diheme cytochrome c family protein